MGLRQRGHDVGLAVGSFEASSSDFPIRIHETGNTDRSSPLEQLREGIGGVHTIRVVDPDMCIIYATSVMLPFSILACRVLQKISRRRSVPTQFIIKMDWDGVRRGKWWFVSAVKIYVYLLSWVSDRITVETTSASERLGAMLSRLSLPVVVPIAADTSIFKPQRDGGGQSPGPIVVTAGRISREKGLDLLIQAFVEATRDLSEWVLQIIGPVEDTTYFAELSRLVERLGLGSRVKFIPEKTPVELNDLYKNASIFATLSLRESIQTARFEAMASGLPVLTSDAGGGRALEMAGSLVVPVGNVAAAARELSRLMKDPSLRAAISASQLRHVHSWDEIAMQYESLVQNVASTSSGQQRMSPTGQNQDAIRRLDT